MNLFRFDYLLVPLFILSAILIVLSNDDPWARDFLCERLQICPRSSHAVAINKGLYDLGFGAVVSLMFYWLFVKVPEIRRRHRIKRTLEKHYRLFKKDCIASILAVVEGMYDFDTVDERTWSLATTSPSHSFDSCGICSPDSTSLTGTARTISFSG